MNTATTTPDGSVLPAYTRALAHSIDDINAYIRRRTALATGMDVPMACYLAAGRFEHLLREARTGMSGVFTENDIETLLNCFQGEIISSPDFGRMARDLCDDLGIHVDASKNSSAGALIAKLLGLASVERAALADVLESAWHDAGRDKLSVGKYCETLGLTLAS